MAPFRLSIVCVGVIITTISAVLIACLITSFVLTSSRIAISTTSSHLSDLQIALPVANSWSDPFQSSLSALGSAFSSLLTESALRLVQQKFYLGAISVPLAGSASVVSHLKKTLSTPITSIPAEAAVLPSLFFPFNAFPDELGGIRVLRGDLGTFMYNYSQAPHAVVRYVANYLLVDWKTLELGEAVLGPLNPGAVAVAPAGDWLPVLPLLVAPYNETPAFIAAVTAAATAGAAAAAAANQSVDGLAANEAMLGVAPVPYVADFALDAMGSLNFSVACELALVVGGCMAPVASYGPRRFYGTIFTNLTLSGSGVGMIDADTWWDGVGNVSSIDSDVDGTAGGASAGYVWGRNYPGGEGDFFHELSPVAVVGGDTTMSIDTDILAAFDHPRRSLPPSDPLALLPVKPLLAEATAVDRKDDFFHSSVGTTGNVWDGFMTDVRSQIFGESSSEVVMYLYTYGAELLTQGAGFVVSSTHPPYLADPNSPFASEPDSLDFPAVWHPLVFQSWRSLTNRGAPTWLNRSIPCPTLEVLASTFPSVAEFTVPTTYCVPFSLAYSPHPDSGGRVVAFSNTTDPAPLDDAYASSLAAAAASVTTPSGGSPSPSAPPPADLSADDIARLQLAEAMLQRRAFVLANGGSISGSPDDCPDPAVPPTAQTSTSPSLPPSTSASVNPATVKDFYVPYYGSASVFMYTLRAFSSRAYLREGAYTLHPRSSAALKLPPGQGAATAIFCGVPVGFFVRDATALIDNVRVQAAALTAATAAQFDVRRRNCDRAVVELTAVVVAVSVLVGLMLVVGMVAASAATAVPLRRLVAVVGNIEDNLYPAAAALLPAPSRRRHRNHRSSSAAVDEAAVTEADAVRAMGLVFAANDRSAIRETARLESGFAITVQRLALYSRFLPASVRRKSFACEEEDCVGVDDSPSESVDDRSGTGGDTKVRKAKDHPPVVGDVDAALAAYGVSEAAPTHLPLHHHHQHPDYPISIPNNTGRPHTRGSARSGAASRHSGHSGTAHRALISSPALLMVPSAVVFITTVPDRSPPSSDPASPSPPPASTAASSADVADAMVEILTACEGVSRRHRAYLTVDVSASAGLPAAVLVFPLAAAAGDPHAAAGSGGRRGGRRIGGVMGGVFEDVYASSSSRVISAVRAALALGAAADPNCPRLAVGVAFGEVLSGSCGTSENQYTLRIGVPLVLARRVCGVARACGGGVAVGVNRSVSALLGEFVVVPVASIAGGLSFASRVCASDVREGAAAGDHTFDDDACLIGLVVGTREASGGTRDGAEGSAAPAAGSTASVSKGGVPGISVDGAVGKPTLAPSDTSDLKTFDQFCAVAAAITTSTSGGAARAAVAGVDRPVAGLAPAAAAAMTLSSTVDRVAAASFIRRTALSTARVVRTTQILYVVSDALPPRSSAAEDGSGQESILALLQGAAGLGRGIRGFGASRRALESVSQSRLQRADVPQPLTSLRAGSGHVLSTEPGATPVGGVSACPLPPSPRDDAKRGMLEDVSDASVESR